jgi:hypothetical protein
MLNIPHSKSTNRALLECIAYFRPSGSEGLNGLCPRGISRATINKLFCTLRQVFVVFEQHLLSFFEGAEENREKVAI